MAHHVQAKATKHHAKTRPRKSRPSDINRVPPTYPPLPDIPWMSPTSLSAKAEKTVTISIAPSDTAADLNSKLTAAGASAVDRFVYGGIELATTLADCGLESESSIEAKCVSAA